MIHLVGTGRSIKDALPHVAAPGRDYVAEQTAKWDGARELSPALSETASLKAPDIDSQGVLPQIEQDKGPQGLPRPTLTVSPWSRWRRARKPMILREFIFWRRIFRNDVVLNNCAVARFSLILCWIVQC